MDNAIGLGKSIYTVEEAKFERVSNFGQIKVFLCELLLTHLSLCRSTHFFERSKYVILNFAK